MNHLQPNSDGGPEGIILDGISLAGLPEEGFISDRPRHKREPFIRQDGWPTEPPEVQMGVRDRRSWENHECIGGMRSPWRAVDRIPGLKEAGRIIREVFEEVLDSQPDEWPEKLLNTSMGETLDEAFAKWLADRLAQKLGVSSEKGRAGRMRPHIARALNELSGDPDVAIPDWLLRGAPIGVEEQIPTHGIFPPVEPAQAAPEADAFWTHQAEGCFYRSVAEEHEWVSEKLQQMTDEHFLTAFPDLAAARREHGDVIINKMACLVKSLPNGDVKRRLIVDMLRSGANRLARVPERIVLPRILDLGACARRLLQMCTGGGFIDQLVLDFVDAFYTIGVLPAETRYQFVQGPDGRVFRFDVLAMGSAAAPLIWGRVAAWVMRLSSAIYSADLVRIQCFVDDPWLAARGGKKERRRRLAVIVLFWLALGLKLSWAKKQFGPEVVWIGVSIGASLEEISLTVAAKFLQKLQGDVAELQAMRAIPLKRLRSVAGGLSWLGGLVRWIRPFLSPLWAAIASAASWHGPPEAATIGANQIQHALLWLAAFLHEQKGSLTRRLAVAPRSVQAVTQILCDASPWGLGATLSIDGQTVRWFGTELSDTDLQILGFERGDCRGQALAEALCIAVALREWAPEWQDERTLLIARSDAIAALGALNKFSSSTPQLNLVVREVALDLAEGRYDVEVMGHVPAEWNDTPDALSRLYAPEADKKQVPKELHAVERTWPAPRPRSWWRTIGAPTVDEHCESYDGSGDQW